VAHFAQLDENNIVTQVIVVSNDDAPDEATGVAFCKALFGSDTNWKQTSYNSRANTHLLGGTPLRKNFAGVGYTYDAGRDAFIPPKVDTPFVMNESTGRYEPPTSPSQKGMVWDLTTHDWAIPLKPSHTTTSDSVKHLTWTEISADEGYMWIFPVNYPAADDPTLLLYEWSDSVYEADNTKGWVLR